MIKLVSFDFDGVLAQGSNEAYVDCYHQALVKVDVHLNPELERERIFARWGQPVEEQVALLLQEHPDKIQAAVQFFNLSRRVPGFSQRVSLYQGAEQTLQTLSEKYSLSIISGSDRALIQKVLGPELTPLFESIYSTGDYEPRLQKPAPHILQQAMAQAGVSPRETVYIGDAPNDLRMAVNAGAEPAAILTGHLNRLSASALGARCIIEDITEFPGALARLSSS